MKRHQLEHIIRAAADIADDDEIVILGSQSILGRYPDAPDELLESNEADVYPRNRPERADLVEGSIGELSPFHETYGYFAEGVAESTAVLPEGWKERLVPVTNANTRGATGWCLEPNDLAIAKYVAGREKDRAFIRAAIGHGLLDKAELLARLAVTPLAEDRRAAIEQAITADFA